MRRFYNCLLFTKEPKWDNLKSLAISHLMTGYAHNRSNVWLLDIYSKGRKRGTFTEEFPQDKPATKATSVPNLFRPGQMIEVKAQPAKTVIGELDLSNSTRTVLERLTKAIDLLTGEPPTKYPPYGIGWLRLALAVEQRVGCPTFFFAADDECMDMACQISKGEIVKAAFDFGDVLRHSDGKTTLTRYVRAKGVPQAFPFGKPKESPKPPADVCEPLAEMGIKFVRPTHKEAIRSKMFQELVTESWPEDAGDPVAILGVGTWDVFLNLDRDYRVVFERKGRGKK